MKLEILTPEKKIFSGEVVSVQVPGSSGKFQMLNMHAPIVSSLENEIKITDLEKKELVFDIKSGVVEIKNNTIIILAE